MVHSDFQPFNSTEGFGATSSPNPDNVTPNSYFWAGLSLPKHSDWVAGQQLLGRNGDPQKKEGLALWIFSVSHDMPQNCAFSSLDGDTLIIPHAGALDIQTELGRLLVRQHEIVVIPRSVRYRVTLPSGRPTCGYICELYQGHFRLPDLGVIGSTGLANIRDFQIPKAHIDTTVARALNTQKASKPRKEEAEKKKEWTIVSRLTSRLWSCTQPQTPFDVAAWHGTSYPYKYDLARFCALGNLRFDEHDPSLFTVLTARNHGAEPSTAVVDFAVIPARWMAARDTLWVPYFHRNAMQEFYAPIIATQDPKSPLNDDGKEGEPAFRPFACGLHGCMSTHGPTDSVLRAERARDTSAPAVLSEDGFTVMLLETDRPLVVSDWAREAAVVNMQKMAAKM